MIMTIYFMLLFTVIGTLFLFLLFIYLLRRKFVLNQRSQQYQTQYRLLYPMISSYISKGGDIPVIQGISKTLFRNVILDILIQMSSSIDHEEEKQRMLNLLTRYRLMTYLTNLLTSKNWWEVVDAIIIIGTLGLTSYTLELKRALYSSKQEIATAAAKALCLLGENVYMIRYLSKHEGDLSQKEMFLFSHFMIQSFSSRKDETNQILNVLPTVSPFLQGIFIELLGRKKAIHTLPVITSYLESDDAELRLKVLRAIGDIGFCINEREIMDLLSSQDPNERLLAVYVTKNCKIYDACQILAEQSLADSSWWVRVRSAEALIALGERGKKKLNWAIHHHPDSFAREISLKVTTEHQLKERGS